MKHLFVVHSNLTYLAALATVYKENLCPEDVVILGDKFSASYPIETQLVKSLSGNQLLRSPRRALFSIGYVDKIIKRTTNSEPYVLYVAALYNVQRICFSNSKCQGLNFIEEGLSVYLSTVSLSRILSNNEQTKSLRNRSCRTFFKDLFKLIKGYSYKMQALPFLYNGYSNLEGVKFYGFNKESFCGVDDVQQLSFVDTINHFDMRSQLELAGGNLWIGSNIVSLGLEPLESYLSAIKEGVVECFAHSSGTRAFVKFHPAECEASRNGTLKLFADAGIEPVVVDDSVIIEVEIFSNTGVTVWGVDSSIMYYASSAGVRCKSIVDRLVNYPKATLPFFWERVETV